MIFLKCLAGGLRYFLELQNGGPPGSRSEGSGEQGGGRPHPSVTPRPRVGAFCSIFVKPTDGLTGAIIHVIRVLEASSTWKYRRHDPLTAQRKCRTTILIVERFGLSPGACNHPFGLKRKYENPEF
jgi:hypothetical protein